jgi:mannose-6-phosphate isomerase-like protein (cupin superfamily)
MTTTAEPRYGIDSYKEWVAAEGLRVYDGVSADIPALDLQFWPRYGVDAAVLHLTGAGDFGNLFALAIPAGGATLPQKHLYEEVIYVVEGRGSTQLEFADGRKRSFEWGPRSLFAIPLNVKHQHFNGDGTKRALLASTTSLPIVIKTFHDTDFIFDNDYVFKSRVGKEEYYAGKGELTLIRPGNNMWETNFVPDLKDIELTEWADRGPGATNIMFALADGIIHGHLSEIAPATYKKAHRHGAGRFVFTVTGTGYSLLWRDGESDFQRVDWHPGVVFPPLDMQFHQHFVTSTEPSRYLATGVSSVRYPLTEMNRRVAVSEPGRKQGVSLSVKEGGNQIEYADQDPRINALWLDELRKNNVTPQFDIHNLR